MTGMGLPVALLFSYMSTATVVRQSNSTALTPDDFDEILFHNPEVCSRCYRTIRENYGPAGEYRRAVRLSEGHRCEDMDRYGELRIHRACTYCSECGAQYGRAEDEAILSSKEASHIAANIAHQLQQRGIDAATDVIKYVVSKLKSDSELQGRDTDIFRKAAKLATKYNGGIHR